MFEQNQNKTLDFIPMKRNQFKNTTRSHVSIALFFNLGNYIKFQLQKMDNNDKNLQLYGNTDLSRAIFEWLNAQVHLVYSSSKKKINLSILLTDIYSQPFLGKFLLKVHYQYFSKTQLMDYIDSMPFRKLAYSQRKGKFLKIIEKYLHQCQRKKFSQGFRECLFNNYEDSEDIKANFELVRIILFIAIRSQNKTQFIERIFKMSAQSQQLLMQQIMQIESNLQNITQKQELILQLNTIKNFNDRMRDNYQQLVDYQNKLLDQCEREDFSRNKLEEKHFQNKRQKAEICQSLRTTEIQRPYLKIYQNCQQKNINLTRILIQKQKRENHLNQQHNSLRSKTDEFEQVLFELQKQRKKLKVILNDKKNQSFKLEMRASLRLSQQKQSFRKSQALKKKSLTFCHQNLGDVSRRMSRNNVQNIKLAVKSKNCGNSKINQSINVLSKIQELKQQKQYLTKQLAKMKQQNKTIKVKDETNKKTLNKLENIYSQILRFLPQVKIQKKQVSKINLGVKSHRYLQAVQS